VIILFLVLIPLLWFTSLWYEDILEIHPRQKAIIVSGFSETERVRETSALGADDYVRKPYAQEKSGMAVRKEIDRKSRVAFQTLRISVIL
jgi:DNA-binding NarL/FixJ family response regulator